MRAPAQALPCSAALRALPPSSLVAAWILLTTLARAALCVWPPAQRNPPLPEGDGGNDDKDEDSHNRLHRALALPRARQALGSQQIMPLHTRQCLRRTYRRDRLISRPGSTMLGRGRPHASTVRPSCWRTSRRSAPSGSAGPAPTEPGWKSSGARAWAIRSCSGAARPRISRIPNGTAASADLRRHVSISGCRLSSVAS